MKKGFLACLVLVLLSSVAFSQTFNYIKSIDCSANGDYLTGCAFYSEAVYLVTFNDQKVLKVTDIDTATPTITEIADLSGEVTWVAQRGLTGIDVDADAIYVTGDDGTGAFIYKLSHTGTVLDSFTDAVGDHRHGGLALWESGNLLVTQTGSGMMKFKSDFSGYDGYKGGADAYNRDVCVVGDDFYASHTNGGATDGITRYTGGTIGDVTSYTPSDWMDTGTGNWAAGCGISYFVYMGMMSPVGYLCFGNRTTSEMELYDSTATKAYNLGTTDNVTDAIDSCAGSVNSAPYFFVTDGSANNLVVFGVDHTTVGDWTLYQR